MPRPFACLASPRYIGSTAAGDGSSALEKKIGWSRDPDRADTRRVAVLPPVGAVLPFVAGSLPTVGRKGEQSLDGEFVHDVARQPFSADRLLDQVSCDDAFCRDDRKRRAGAATAMLLCVRQESLPARKDCIRSDLRHTVNIRHFYRSLTRSLDGLPAQSGRRGSGIKGYTPKENGFSGGAGSH